jgi:hypothetical protein
VGGFWVAWPSCLAAAGFFSQPDRDDCSMVDEADGVVEGQCLVVVPDAGQLLYLISRDDQGCRFFCMRCIVNLYSWCVNAFRTKAASRCLSGVLTTRTPIAS